MKVISFAATILMGTVVAEDIVVFGDSWGDCRGSRNAFAEMVESNGRSVRNVAVGGTKTSDWATFGNRNYLRDVVEETGAEFVWLTIGGNDYLEDERSFDEILPGMLNNTQRFLDPLFERFPDTKVVQFGYDILNWNQNLNCRGWAQMLFDECNAFDTRCQNEQFYQIHDKYVRALSEIYPNHFTLEIIGALQNQAGSPDFGRFSDASLVMSDCIHLEDEGYRIISSAMYDNYFYQFW